MGQSPVARVVGADATVAAPDRFEKAIEAHRRELLVHCYRLLGSWTDAEDCVQEVSIRAWRGIGRFEGRSQVRTWLYRIATNVCLTRLRTRRRRQLPEAATPATPKGAMPGPPIEPERWIEPFPSDPRTDVEEAAARRETLTLAFVAALQCLPPKQRAVLLLRDVVGYEASEVAGILQTGTPAVNSALVRARDRMARFRERHGREPLPKPVDAAQRRILTRYVAAWEAGDVETLVSLLSRDAIVTMPPFATWYRGRAALREWLAMVLEGGRRFRLFPTLANGRAAFAFYKSGGPCLPGEKAHAAFEPHCIQMVWFGRRGIARIANFVDARLVRSFGFGPRPPVRAKK
jgi:RNA polymerase sigma-70 factor (ECF subfamily)